MLPYIAIISDFKMNVRVYCNNFDFKINVTVYCNNFILQNKYKIKIADILQ